jgi:hypothetical protein
VFQRTPPDNRCRTWQTGQRQLGNGFFQSLCRTAALQSMALAGTNGFCAAAILSAVEVSADGHRTSAQPPFTQTHRSPNLGKMTWGYSSAMARRPGVLVFRGHRETTFQQPPPPVRRLSGVRNRGRRIKVDARLPLRLLMTAGPLFCGLGNEFDVHNDTGRVFADLKSAFASDGSPTIGSAGKGHLQIGVSVENHNLTLGAVPCKAASSQTRGFGCT